ncbi:hypothetical protein FA15DRAFT_614903 [Coprinopsis marcescibilis]|uniref:MARVEL domain-containing protein n=1 Tax=Coprinopsis marcescibilis TaxID=230819 RepID=A0A5C3L1Y0_COPMA|nr:hypothetical protein FA15DRAFT_614903 [Coprinopsis marcescibilis]
MVRMWPVRAGLHGLLWCCAVVLLGLTAYRVRYTKHRREPDVLTDRTRYYDPIIVELLVTSALAIIGSLFFLITLAGRKRAGGLSSFAGEQVYLFIIMVMFLVGAAITTHKWLHLKWCRSHYRVCSVLETVKAFSFICFGLACLLILFGIIDLILTRSSPGDSAAGTKKKTAMYPATNTAGYPETRTAAAAPTVPPAAQPATRTTETTYTEVRAADGTTGTTGTHPV